MFHLQQSLDSTDMHLRHKFKLHLSGDSNFKLQRKNKRDDPDDITLNAGNGYFVETEEYQRYLKLVKLTEDVSQLYLSYIYLGLRAQ
jgi:hypothetical protein